MSVRWYSTAACILLLAAGSAAGAGHEDVTVIPLGTVEIKQGPQDGNYRVPFGPLGPRRQALVLVASQPMVEAEAPPVTNPEAVDAENKTKHPVPATIRISAGGKVLPAWTLQPHRTAYVINLATLQAAPDYPKGRIALSVTLESEAQGAQIVLLGMPDPLLADNTTDGPLEKLIDVARAAGNADAEKHLQALFDEFAGQADFAKAGYETVARSTANPRAARMARRGLRMISYLTRERKLSGNWLEHYRWGLCLQFWGLFDPAFREFDECRIIMPERGDAQYRAAECLEMIGAGPLQYILYMDRTGEADKSDSPALWQTLVAILRNRDGTPLSIEQNHGIRDSCLFADKMLWGATDSRLWPVTGYFEMEDESRFAHVEHPGSAVGPVDDLVHERGWYDVVISARPRKPDENARDVRLAGADAGPNGAALVSLFHDAGWMGHIRAWYMLAHHMAGVNEQARGLPTSEDAVDCGPPPVPNSGYAYRSALRYHLNGDHVRGWNIAEPPAEDTYLQLWQLEGPFPVKASGDGVFQSHVMEPIGTGAPKTERVVIDGQFVDLAAVFPNAGHARARGTTWVYCPADREVMLRFGRNDVLAAQLNGQWVLKGTAPAAHKFEDKNLVDTLFRLVRMKRGWNELQVIVEGWPAPKNAGWGFSVSVTDNHGEPIPGLASLHTKPKDDLVKATEALRGGKGQYFNWDDVKRDRRMLLPELSVDDLRAITGEPKLELASTARPFAGYVALHAPGRGASPVYRAMPAAWDDAKDSDVTVNNLLDWGRESVLAYRYVAEGHARDLLLVKPEAIEAIVQCLHEPNITVTTFRTLPVAKRIMGYVVVPVGSSQRVLFAVDAQVGEKDRYPADEEDLLTPFGPFVPNWPDQFDKKDEEPVASTSSAN